MEPRDWHMEFKATMRHLRSCGWIASFIMRGSDVQCPGVQHFPTLPEPANNNPPIWRS